MSRVFNLFILSFFDLLSLILLASSKKSSNAIIYNKLSYVFLRLYKSVFKHLN